MHPDDVVSARLYDDLCAGLRERGWDVEARPSNRGCRDENMTYPRSDSWRGVSYRRVWRPRFRQSSPVGRVLNSTWMIAAWSRIALRPASRLPDVVIVGTDPMFGVLVALPLKTLRRRVRIAHWCFDLHPECAIAEGMVREDALLTRLVRRLMASAYRRCDSIVDIGSCMRDRLRRYDHAALEATLAPWALEEPVTPLAVDPATRRALFGDAKLGLLYSGNFGQGHTHEPFFRLARELREDPLHFCFAVRGNRSDSLRRAIRPGDTNISLAPFASQKELAKRLGAADIHLASLSPPLTGTIVPSKFFGSLAAGRPVLYAGSAHSAIGRWVEQNRVGWVLTDESHREVAGTLRDLPGHPEELAALRQRAAELYKGRFSRETTIDAWDLLLRALLQ